MKQIELKHKLAIMQEELQNKEVLEELWQDLNGANSTNYTEAFQNVTINFDT